MNEAPAKHLHIKTYGCQMNVYDSERMADILRPLGYALTDEVGRADLVILNTCHIREKASEKVYSELGRLKELREDRLRQGGGRLGIGVAGCVAQAEGQELMRRQSAVDFVVGPQALHQIPELIARQTWAMGERLAADFSPVDKFDALPKAREAIGPAAFLTVQEGCDKFCTFCVVPYTRGAEWSRPVADILDEARRLADQGVHELTLLGQNVNNFNGPDANGQPSSLGRLLSDLAEIPGLERLRYTTSHPNDMGEDLIAAHRDLPQVMPYLHLPVQSGSDRVLKAMNRKHTAAAYIDVIDRLRQARPDIAISGDFIVGFPGELDADFEATLALIERVNYASAFSFKYSPRPGTPAAGMTAQVDEAVKDERLQRLQALIQAQFLRFNRAQVGKVLPVLLEKPGRHAGQAVGKSPYLQSVHIDGAADQIGQIVNVRIRAAVGNSLAGDLVLEPMSCPA